MSSVSASSGKGSSAVVTNEDDGPRKRHKTDREDKDGSGDISSGTFADKSSSPKMQDFLSSMTFASRATFSEFCDCDEPNCTQKNVIPADVAAAIEAYKQKRRLYMDTKSSGSIGNNERSNHRSNDESDDDSFFRIPLTFKPKVTQTRELIWRLSPQLAVWRWTMPVDAEPLIEYGNNHRIIYIKKLLPSDGNSSTPSKLISIGKGIFGSSEEEKRRKDTKWRDGKIYFVPSNGGKALGWIHKRGKEIPHAKASAKENDATPSDAKLIQIKIDPLLTEDDLRSTVGDQDDMPSIVSTLKELLKQSENANHFQTNEALEVTRDSDIAVIMSFLSKVEGNEGPG